MWPFTRKAPPPRPEWIGAESFFDWTEADLDAIGQAMRSHGQPDAPDWEVFALITLNTLRGRDAIEMVCRAIEAHANPDLDPDRPIEFGHYMHGMPAWCMWAEYARPAVRAYCKRALAQQEVLDGDKG